MSIVVSIVFGDQLFRYHKTILVFIWTTKIYCVMYKERIMKNIDMFVIDVDEFYRVLHVVSMIKKKKCHSVDMTRTCLLLSLAYIFMEFG